jgi:DNA helicase-2/ATP-dependent DNA helicase PcrA
MSSQRIEDLWQQFKFSPNTAQDQAIRHVDGPLYLPAGPGSGKTRVLLWRTVNLIAFQQVRPREIFLSTFTEKAATQLREGLRTLLGAASNLTGQQYDVGEMYVGTVHSLCQKIPLDRHLLQGRERGNAPALLDSLSQYFHLSNATRWQALLDKSGFDIADVLACNERINGFFGENRSKRSRHQAVQHVISLFNRFSEECLSPQTLAAHLADDDTLKQMVAMYAQYLATLQVSERARLTDFSLLQQEALNVLERSPAAQQAFKHIIIDEYQDTNTVQERIFFELARGHKNLCVVGDDDQAMYRFRGATVENFVQFPQRCRERLGRSPAEIPLDTNYRSRQRIVALYTAFMQMGCDWQRPQPQTGAYRVTSKQIRAHSTNTDVSVVASNAAKPEAVCAEIAELVRSLIDNQRVADPNQIAFLFPSLKSKQVERMRHALEAVGLRVYAPRADSFLQVEEVTDMLGLFVQVFGRPKLDRYGDEAEKFNEWLDTASARADDLCAQDTVLRDYLGDCKAQIKTLKADLAALNAVIEAKGWTLEAAFQPRLMLDALAQARGLTPDAKRYLLGGSFNRSLEARIRAGNPPTLRYVITTATSLDWTVLDLFYRLCGFGHFRHMFDLAENGEDEGPICNLGLLSNYLARFNDEFSGIITASSLTDDKFSQLFFIGFLYALFRLGETEFEDPEDPFPRGRIPFLTVHQSKGLEFPVVVLGNTAKRDMGPQRIETIVRPFVQNAESEPLERVAEFDIMRMFYVALSRAQNLLVVAQYKGSGKTMYKAFKTVVPDLPLIRSLDVNTLPKAELDQHELPQTYSYTGDFLFYQKCPRQYMVFKKYGFAASRTQTMTFGTLVHRTIEDLHQFLIAQREVTQ